MSLDTLEVFGTEYTNVAGFKATDDNDQIKTYIRPQGNLAITANTASVDVSQYATASVAVPSVSEFDLEYVPGSSAFTFNTTYDTVRTALANAQTIVQFWMYDENYGGLRLAAGYGEVFQGSQTINGTTFTECIELHLEGNDNEYYSVAWGYSNGSVVQAIRRLALNPSGTLSINQNATGIDVAAYASVDVAVPSPSAGTEGTPVATKGTVSNHQVTVTPSVTNVGGVIQGGTHSGTPVTVSASELVSGSETKTANGTYDVTNLETIVVDVSGSSKNIQVNQTGGSVRTNGYTSTGVSLTVAKAGTYKVTWTAWRSSSQGTMGTNLYKNDTAGTAQQTWTSTYGQHITLNNQTYAQGDVLTLYATAGSTSRYCYVGDLVIVEQ